VKYSYHQARVLVLFLFFSSGTLVSSSSSSDSISLATSSTGFCVFAAAKIRAFLARGGADFEGFREASGGP
jgi:hypothetical protein